MAELEYNNNAIRNQKLFKPIANGNVADSGMIAVNSLLNISMLFLFLSL